MSTSDSGENALCNGLGKTDFSIDKILKKLLLNKILFRILKIKNERFTKG